MRKLTGLIISFFFLLNYLSAAEIFVFKNQQPGLKKIIEIKNSRYFITSDAVYLINKNNLEIKLKLPAACNDACIYNDEIILATNTGLKIFDKEKNTIKDYSRVSNKIDHVITDKQNNIWFTQELEGGFKIVNDSVYRIIEAPAVYSLAETPDSNVWVGTNVGLYRISLTENKIFRFEEEGIEGFELPDNLVENIYADNTSNVWAIMPGDISFIAAAGEADEIPDYSYVGSRENQVLDICKIPVSSRSYLFATKQGLIYTSDLKGDEFNHSGEIHQEFHEAAFFINDELTEKPSVFKASIVTSIQVSDSNIYFITDKGMWQLSLAKFKNKLTKAQHK